MVQVQPVNECPLPRGELPTLAAMYSPPIRFGVCVLASPLTACSSCSPVFPRAPQIDGKVINGVDEILKYLLEKYPGEGTGRCRPSCTRHSRLPRPPGTAENGRVCRACAGKVEKQLKKDGREAELLSFCDLATRARKGPDQPDQRLCRIGVLEAGACWGPGVREHALRRSYLKARQNPELEELQDCYLREIVKVRVKDSLGGYRTEGNAPAGEEKLQELLDAAEAVLEGSGTAFLFGEDPCMADACMAPIIFRLNYLYRNRLKRVFRKHPAVSWYWDRLRCLPETRKAVISPAKAAGFVQAWAALCPYRLYLALKLGGNFDGAKLPDEQETHVQEACEVACAAKVSFIPSPTPRQSQLPARHYRLHAVVPVSFAQAQYSDVPPWDGGVKLKRNPRGCIAGR